jgi:hypothetical protein
MSSICCERECCAEECRPMVCCEKEREAQQPGVLEQKYGHVKARRVTINQQDFGYTVDVGCQTFCLESLDTVLNMLIMYLTNPEKLEKQWREGKLKMVDGSL